MVPQLIIPIVKLPLFIWNYWERTGQAQINISFLFLEKDDLQTQPNNFSGHFHERIIPFSRELGSPFPTGGSES